MKAVSFINQGVHAQAGTLDDFDRPMALLGNAFEGVLSGRPVFFSWRSLFSEQPADPRELRRFIEVKPVLDYAALMPGKGHPISFAERERSWDSSPNRG